MFYVYHAFGSYFSISKDILEAKSKLKFTTLKSIEIISPMNEICYKDSYLVKQCEASNVELLKSEKVFNVSKEDWTNLEKIKAVVDMLEKGTSKYVLILDGKDTCILNNLDTKFLNTFKEYEADIVFNMQTSKHPLVDIETEEFLEANKFKYINAGVCVGYRDKLLEFYKECLNNISDVYLCNSKKPSEQYLVRKLATSSDIVVRCDYDLKLFASYKDRVNL